MSRIHTSNTKSMVFELLVIAGMMTVTMGLLLPVVLRADRVGTGKTAVHKVRHQSLVSHRTSTPFRSANL